MAEDTRHSSSEVPSGTRSNPRAGTGIGTGANTRAQEPYSPQPYASPSIDIFQRFQRRRLGSKWSATPTPLLREDDALTNGHAYAQEKQSRNQKEQQSMKKRVLFTNLTGTIAKPNRSSDADNVEIERTVRASFAKRAAEAYSLRNSLEYGRREVDRELLEPFRKTQDKENDYADGHEADDEDEEGDEDARYRKAGGEEDSVQTTISRSMKANLNASAASLLLNGTHKLDRAHSRATERLACLSEDQADLATAHAALSVPLEEERLRFPSSAESFETVDTPLKQRVAHWTNVIEQAQSALVPLWREYEEAEMESIQVRERLVGLLSSRSVERRVRMQKGFVERIEELIGKARREERILEEEFANGEGPA